VTFWKIKKVGVKNVEPHVATQNIFLWK